MYLAIEGVIGVGKTTLARLLQTSFQSNLLLEVFEENPFLSSFYADRARYAFQTQIFFLLSRYHQQNQGIPKSIANGASLISDYTFEKDALFAQINLQDNELAMYNRVHEALGEKVIRPDLIVYLRAETPLLMQRITLRDRPYERDMDENYIDQVNRAYDEFFLSAKTASQVLVIETQHLDYVRYSEDLRWIENRIRQSLAMPPFQPELPLPNHSAD
jgi:deoxyguanosine kinase